MHILVIGNGFELHIIEMIIVLLAIVVILAFIKKKREVERKKKAEFEVQNELLKNIKKFQGLFQVLDDAIYTSDEELVQRALSRWKKEATKMPYLNHFLNQLSNGNMEVNSLDIGKQLLNRFETWGIHHDFRGKILIATNELNKFYIMDEFYENGEQLMVESPCWYCKVDNNTICIEPGTAIIFNSEEKK